MEQTSINEELLAFFKALADANRLKIVGMLAQKPSTVEGLAEALGLGTSTVSHHLSKLSRAGLVTARTDGHYYIYSLQTEAIQEMAQRLLNTQDLPRLSEQTQTDSDAFDRKVKASFLTAEGKIKAFPSQEKKLLVLLRHTLQAFEPGQKYTEKQVNEILSQFNEDTAFLRRSLYEYKMMDRQGGGGLYWVKEE